VPEGTVPWHWQNFDTPFKHSCTGVVITQSHGYHNSATNIAARAFSKDGFSYYAETWEISEPIYYIAFGY